MESAADWRAAVEELTCRLAGGTADASAWVASLRGFAHRAAEGGRRDLARLAAESLQQLEAAADPTLPEFLKCILRLQKATGAPTTAPLNEDSEMMGDFIQESREHLAQVELQMMTLEKDPRNREAIDTVFRAFHTIKGLAGFLDLPAIRDVAHETETILDLVRKQQITVTSTVVDLVLAAGDFLKAGLQRLEARLAGVDVGEEPGTPALLERLRTGARGDSLERPAAAPGPGWRVNVPGNSVRVNTDKLDALVEMAGEMMAQQGRLSQSPEVSPALSCSLAQLSRLAGEVRQTALSMRLVPLNGLFQKMNRLVRDVARKTGKTAELETLGGETELDRYVVQELADPLLHMVRNAVDHGLERAEERVAASKDGRGRVRLTASQQAGHLVIEVADDGRGLVRGDILAQARRMGLLAGDGLALPDQEVFHFIFYPGFSTAPQLTDVSGRGVGMDVVRRQVQKLRGRIEIQSQPGAGTSFLLWLPCS